MTFPYNKKNLQLYFRDYIFESYNFLVKVTFILYPFNYSVWNISSEPISYFFDLGIAQSLSYKPS